MSKQHEPLLLAGQTRGELIDKLTGSASPRLTAMWRHFLILARNNPFWFSPYSVLAWLISGEERYREIAREHFLSLMREKDAGLVSNEVQIHTHTTTAPLVHTMILYDWIQGTGLLSPEEEAAFADAMCDLVFQTAIVNLRGRARRFDNQVFSSALSAAVTGFVIGRCHGATGRARLLYTRGHEWTVDQLSRLTEDCYSLEGSTYHELIVMPLITLAAAFIEEVDGTPAYALGVQGGTPVRDWLVAYERMIGASGLLPGWDQYGVMRASSKMPLVYCAQKDRCGAPLAKIIATDMWYPLCHSTWEFADRLWALVWWQDDLIGSDPYLQQDWIVPRTAGAIHHGSARLFQYWDEAGPAPHTGRPQLNPNAIQFDRSGLPLLLDGEPAPGVETLNRDQPAMRAYLGDPMLQALAQSWNMELTEERIERQIERAIAGNIGASNSLIIDGEDWFVPRHAVRGTGRKLLGAGRVRLIESDAAAMYGDRYDISACMRTSLLIGESIVLSVDRIVSKTPHHFTWQAFTWPGATLRDGGAVVLADSAVQLDLLAPDGAETTLTPIDQFPRWPCQSSTRVRMERAKASSEVIFPVCLVAQDTVAAGTDISTGWSHNGEGHASGEIDLNTFYLTDDSATGTAHRFDREVICAESDLVRGMLLRVASGGPTTRLLINGHEVPPVIDQDSAEVDGRSFSIPSLYNLTHILQAGVNTLRFETIGFHGETLMGPIRLQPFRPVETPSVVSVGDSVYEITTAAGIDRVHLGGEDAISFCGGTCRAASAVNCADGALALLGVDHADLPNASLQVSATRAIDLSISGNTVTLGALKEGRTAVVALHESLIRIDTTAGIEISCAPAEPLILHLEGVETGCVVNGAFVRAQGGEVRAELSMDHPSPSMDVNALTPEALYRYGQNPNRELESIVLTALRSDDWRVQVAGADLAGNYRLRGAVDTLLLCFIEEGKQPVPAYRTHWIRSKMNSAIAEGVDHRPAPNLDPVRDAKGGRLRQAIIIALGLIGDVRACPSLRVALAEGNDHFLTRSQISVALARLEDRDAIAVLQAHANVLEVNVNQNMGRALAYLEGRLSRDAFESELNG